MLLSDVCFVYEVPVWPEFTASGLWTRFKDDPQVNIYFPDFPNNRFP